VPGMAISAGDGKPGSLLFVDLTMAAYTLPVIGCSKFNRSVFRVAGSTSGASIFVQLIFIQDVLPVLVIVVAVQAFKGFHVVFV